MNTQHEPRFKKGDRVVAVDFDDRELPHDYEGAVGTVIYSKWNGDGYVTRVRLDEPWASINQHTDRANWFARRLELLDNNLFREGL